MSFFSYDSKPVLFSIQSCLSAENRKNVKNIFSLDAQNPQSNVKREREQKHFNKAVLFFWNVIINSIFVKSSWATVLKEHPWES